MRVGIYQDLRDPPRWKRGWSANAGAALERIEAAEQAGIGAVWCTEHHFFDDGYLPQALTWCAAVAARTNRVAIGTAIVVAPLHDPLEIAEQAAVVDQLSGGRLQLGLGAGYVRREFAAFGADRARRFELTDTCLTELRRLFDQGIITPGPLQKELPLWFGGSGPRGARLAGRHGAGLLWVDPDLLAPYQQGLKAAGRSAADARMAGIASLILSRDPERAWSALTPHIRYQRESYDHSALAKTPEARMAEVLENDGKVERSRVRSVLPRIYDAVTPDEAVRRVTTWIGDLPVTDVFFWDSIAGMPDDLVDEHLELLATDVAPRLRGLGKAPLPPALER